ncbi:DUF1592 domain-containing protein [Zavarzinella formosa]|uniref:DUF1592 domain-containing protein n=1 Tax=Zavarzinella formosa TaxID=360055 RepID=UPI0002FADEDB|nr:DUF1592 domain-containing protein [Zavarzinella formosa]
MRRLNFVFVLLIGGVANHCHGATGEQIYTTQCAFCHGKAGEGSKKYPKPLIGDKSSPQLALQIQKTMPKEDPGSLSKEDSLAVASYAFDKFYSVAARERNNPVRVELARLTVSQYRNAVADMIGHFRGNATWWDKNRGLKGEYFKERNPGKRLIERTDPEVKFDFGVNAPAEKDFDAKEFSIRWTGSVLIPETGEYTFIVKSNQSVRLFVNDNKNPIADGYVRSGNDNEYKGTVYLLGGRVYPIRLDFSKALQGVKDKNPKPLPAFVTLLWQQPNGTAETIPSRQLSPQWSPETYVVTTKFPPDDRSYGWERGTTVSKAWDQATTDSALDAADYVSLRINELAKTNEKDDKRAEKIKTFIRQMAKLAFRKPVTDDLEKVYVTRPMESNPDLQAAVKRAMLMILKSPRFLYREPSGGEPDQYDVAARMAFAMWDSIPNQELLDLAAAGKLKTPEEVKKHLNDKMIWDTRAKTRLLGFLHHWLKTDHGRDAVKDAKRFPGFDAAIVGDLRTSLDLTLDDVVWSDKSDFRQLLISEETFLNGRLAKYYGVDLPADASFAKTAFEPGKRTGVLTHPYLMTTLAYSAETSPIHRGVFLAKGILGTGLKPPQEAFTPIPAELHPNLTTRQRVELQTKGANCQSCHLVINPLGFALENFDAVGRYRLKDNNKEIDPTGTYLTRSGETKTFKGAGELAKFLAGSPDVHTAFAEQMFHHLVQQSVRAYGSTRTTELRDTFTKSGFHVRQLAVEIVAGSALAASSKTVRK